MYPLDKFSSRAPLVVLALSAALALAPACGDSGNTSTEGATTTGETTSTTAPATTDDPTTGPGTTTGTSTSTGTSTTGDPGVCDGSMASDAFACVACNECGSWTTPLAGSDYPPAVVCLLEAMRDDAMVGAGSEACEQGKCLVDRLLTTGKGTLISQQMILDQNDQSMKFLGIQELPFKEAAYFETCLAAYDETCATPNNWFSGASMDIVDLVCP